MRIALHAREVFSSAGKGLDGIPRVNRAILENLPSYSDNDEFIAFCRNDYLGPKKRNVEYRKSIQRLLRNDDIGAALESKLSRAKVSYSLSTAVPKLQNVLTIGIIHDLVPLTFPELAWDPKSGNQRIEEAKTLFRSIVDHADLIHCNSVHTRNEVKDYYKIPEERLFVAYPGVTFTNATHTERPYTRRYLLSVSRIDPRKNLVRLVEAFSRAVGASKNEDIDLVIIGKDGWRTEEVKQAISESSLRGRIVLAGFVPDDELPNYYSHADWYICPSLTEGFGLPVAEAVLAGCPALVSDAGALPELVEDRLFRFDPTNTSEIEDALYGVLTGKLDRSAALIDQTKTIGKFTMESMSTSIMKAIRQAV